MRNRILFAILLLAASCLMTVSARAQPQQQYPRVRGARADKQASNERLFGEKGLEYPPHEVFLRVFKHEKVLELWARGSAKQPFTRVKSYPICALSGNLGPKRRQGDRQIPEGFYQITTFNPASNFHLSFKVDYPNRSDRILGKTPLGGDIFIHGACVTIGCIPITDDLIEELYLVALDVHSRGSPVRVHIFPARLTKQNLERMIETWPEHAEFWRNLKEGFDYFESKKKLPRVTVAPNGKYLFR